jgi:hypothetical protein
MVESNCYAKYALHDSAITHMVLLPQSGVLISAGEDGNLFMMDLKYDAGGPAVTVSRRGSAHEATQTQQWVDGPVEGGNRLALVMLDEYKANIEVSATLFYTPVLLL